MAVVILLIFVSLALVLGSLLLFARTYVDRAYEHTERLALLPLDDDLEPATSRADSQAENNERKK